MGDTDESRPKRDVSFSIPGRSAVFAVLEQRGTDSGHLRTYLMRPSCKKPYGNERAVTLFGDYRVIEERFFGIMNRSVMDRYDIAAGILAQIVPQTAGGSRRGAVDHSYVYFLE